MHKYHIQKGTNQPPEAEPCSGLIFVLLYLTAYIKYKTRVFAQHLCGFYFFNLFVLRICHIKSNK